MSEKSFQIVIAGGGTGGHVYPALVIAETLQKINSKIQIDFVGTDKGIETKLIPKTNFKLHTITVSGLKGQGLQGLLKGFFQIPISFVQTWLLISKLKPKVVLGVGGYASGPFVFVSALRRIPTAIWEPNAYPGWTNRILSLFVNRVFAVYESTASTFKRNQLQFSGMPLRAGIEPVTRKSSHKLRVLIFGGSQGARGINTAVSEAVRHGGEWLQHVELVHQTGEHDFEKVKDAYAHAPSDFQVHRFLYDMPDRYAWADVVFCRSGAGTVAELAAARKAAVLIPFPFAADNHQQHNAEQLQNKNAAQMILQKNFTAEVFIATVQEFIKNQKLISAFEQKIAQFDRPGAAQQIAQSLLEMINSNANESPQVAQISR